MQISSQRHQQQQPIANAPVRGAKPTTAQRPVQGPVDATPAAKVHPQGGVSGTDTASNLARLDGFAEALMERFRAAAADAPEGDRPAFREAAAAIESGLARLREGLADGTLLPSDVQRGVANVFQAARDTLQTARAAGDVGVEETKPEVTNEVEAPKTDAKPEADTGAQSDAAKALGEMARNRFNGFADSVLARIENAEMPDDKRAAMAAGVAEAFESAMGRLDAALFDPRTGDPIDRGTFQQIFSASLGALQEQLSFLFEGTGDGEKSGVVYGADRSAERLAPAGRGLDLAG